MPVGDRLRALDARFAPRHYYDAPVPLWVHWGVVGGVAPLVPLILASAQDGGLGWVVASVVYGIFALSVLVMALRWYRKHRVR